jgi:hypothetical protein
MVRSRSVSLFGLALFYAASASAGWPCSIDHAYPEVSSLDVENGKLVATLGTHFFSRKEKVEISGTVHEVYVREFPRLIMSATGDWERLDVVNRVDDWYGTGKQCIETTPDPQAAKEFRQSPYVGESEYDWYNESIQSCASDGEYNWGGITFYDSEGGWGAGGFVRQHLETAAIEYVRPRELLTRSTGPLAYFAGELWFGQTFLAECAGPPSGTGLKQLVFHDYSESYRVKEVPEVCGFAIRDFQEFEGELWVATELGLSRLTEQDGLRWTNFVPDMSGSSLVREVQCDDLYAELLSSKTFAGTEGFDLGYAFDDFWERLSELRPEFVRQHLRELHGVSSE